MQENRAPRLIARFLMDAKRGRKGTRTELRKKENKGKTRAPTLGRMGRNRRSGERASAGRSVDSFGSRFMTDEDRASRDDYHLTEERIEREGGRSVQAAWSGSYK